MQGKRVVVTGMGCISPVGNSVGDAWHSIRSGVSGVDEITRIVDADFPVRFGGVVKDFDGEALFGKKECRKMDAFIQYGLQAAIEAYQQADLKEFDQDRAGVAFGSAIGGIETIEKNHQQMLKSGARRVSPFFIPSVIVNMLAGHVSMRFNLRGPNVTVATACASGTHNIGMAARAIAYGDADVMLAGASEMCSSPLGMAGFFTSKALSTRSDAPQQASRPWDKDRDGFVIGEGAAALVLESLEHAQARGANILAELVGFGMSGDAHHITAPREDGEGAARSMKAALNDAAISTKEISYINAHATSTPLGDDAECAAVTALFRENTSVLMSSTKSMTGHLLGAAGAIESIFTIKALEHQLAPPTINLDNCDVDTHIDLVPHKAKAFTGDYAMNNSFGFGGTNASLIFSRYK